MRLRASLGLFLLLCFSPLDLLAVDVKGFVFNDLNRNGVMDSGEAGIPNVPISDGLKIVRTDSHGRFAFDASYDPIKGLCFVFVIKPSNWKPTNGWYRRIEGIKQGEEVKFGLAKEKEESNFTFVHVSDIHLSPLFTDFVKEINLLFPQAGFVISTGDQVNAGGVAEFEAFCKMAHPLRIPLFCTVGNHDLRHCIVPVCRKYDLENPKLIFERISKHPELSRAPHKALTDDGLWRLPYMDALGPCWYSFDYANWHIIALDAHAFFPIDGKWVVSSDFEDVQLEWLSKVLEECAGKKPMLFTTNFVGGCCGGS